MKMVIGIVVLGFTVVLVLYSSLPSVNALTPVQRVLAQTAPGQIIVDKVTLDFNGNPLTGDQTFFDFELTDVPTGTLISAFSLRDADTPFESPGLDANIYEVSEDVPNDWTLDSATCDDGSAPSAINLQPGEIVTCTFTNKQLAPTPTPTDTPTPIPPTPTPTNTPTPIPPTPTDTPTPIPPTPTPTDTPTPIPPTPTPTDTPTPIPPTPTPTDTPIPNRPPTVVDIAAPMDPVNFNNQPIVISAVFTDPDVLDTHVGVWEWGDGSQCSTDTDPDCALDQSQGEWVVSGEHSYTEPGVYNITLTVSDDGGGIAVASPDEPVVVYDPTGGFVTGGGWIDSPAEAYVADPSLEGKAIFGFVSKYKKGANTPTGNTRFQFKAGDLNFNSDVYDWLVVAGHKAMFKGTGTINGAGDYGFLLSAIDAELTPRTDDVDKFRIKIWDKDAGDAITYDNQVACLDTGDNANPCTEIGGGSIMIHKAK